MAELKLIKFKLNDRELSVAPGTLVIEAAKRQGIEVPSFCYYQGLSLQAACRMCLVEVEKAPKLQTACTLVAMDGMVVRTETEQVRQARKAMLEFLLTNHPLDCPVCDKGGECELQDMVFRYGADTSRFVEEKIHTPEEKWSPVVYYDAPRCILCFRCVRVCDEGMDVKALGVGQRGALSTIIPNGGDHLECEECGMCIDICPVGALTSGAYRYKTRPWEMEYKGTVCAHCSNGCKTTLSVRNNQILRGNNRDLSGINKDFLCIKGRFGFDFVHHPERLKQPFMRRDGVLQPTSWEDALAEVGTRLAAVHKQHGAQAIGFIGSNRTTNEENYMLTRLARGVVGTNNIDHHRTADYAGLAAALGEKSSQGALATMEQLCSAKCILLIGNDPTKQNPLVAWQIRSAVRLNSAKFYALNAKAIRLHRKATTSLICEAGGEAAIVKWLATGQGDMEAETVLDLIAIQAAIEKEKDVVIVFGAELTGAAIRDLVTFGSKLQGQTRYVALGDYANSRGAADLGLQPEFLPGYGSVSDAAERERWSKAWGASLPAEPGLDARTMLSGNKLKALYVVGANPLKTFGAARPAGLEVMIVHELFQTDTARQADIVLPATCAYEKEGTMTATSGEVQLVRKGVDAMGPRSDFDLLRIVSHQLARAGVGKAIHLRTPETVFEEIRQSVRGYDVSLSGLLTGSAEPAMPVHTNGHKAYDVPLGAILPAGNSLFTSGSLTQYCAMVSAVPEAQTES
ncbi:MAG: NADH-quinone oxidoreductase subunit NuoG [Acidobacteria bacterium]|nr:NADH-quinone oxidoreductase subunit NuoG [Acidobacteriota bacterium]